MTFETDVVYVNTKPGDGMYKYIYPIGKHEYNGLMSKRGAVTFSLFGFFLENSGRLNFLLNTDAIKIKKYKKYKSRQTINELKKRILVALLSGNYNKKNIEYVFGERNDTKN